MKRQDSKSVVAPLAALVVAAVAAGCAGAMARSEPSPPATPPPVVAPGCYSASDCSAQELCVDPRYPLCGAIPACEESGLLRCGCACVAVGAGPEGCGSDEVRGPSGCCEARPCTADAECGLAEARCLAGRCARRGTCELPPP